MCVDCAILHCHYRTETVITVVTVFFLECFTKICQQNTTTTNSTLTVSDHVLKLLTSNALFLFVRFLSNEVFLLDSITIAEEDDTLSRQAITSCPT